VDIKLCMMSLLACTSFMVVPRCLVVSYFTVSCSEVSSYVVNSLVVTCGLQPRG
jgi:hypothetical protein